MGPWALGPPWAPMGFWGPLQVTGWCSRCANRCPKRRIDDSKLRRHLGKRISPIQLWSPRRRLRIPRISNSNFLMSRGTRFGFVIRIFNARAANPDPGSDFTWILQYYNRMDNWFSPCVKEIFQKSDNGPYFHHMGQREVYPESILHNYWCRSISVSILIAISIWRRVQILLPSNIPI